MTCAVLKHSGIEECVRRPSQRQVEETVIAAWLPDRMDVVIDVKQWRDF